MSTSQSRWNHHKRLQSWCFLNAEQEAANLRKGTKTRKRIYYSMKLSESNTKKKHYWRLKRKARKYREGVDVNLSQSVRAFKQIENRLTERATSLDRKDDNWRTKEKLPNKRTKKYFLIGKKPWCSEEQLEKWKQSKRSRRVRVRLPVRGQALS